MVLVNERIHLHLTAKVSAGTSLLRARVDLASVFVVDVTVLNKIINLKYLIPRLCVQIDIVMPNLLQITPCIQLRRYKFVCNSTRRYILEATPVEGHLVALVAHSSGVSGLQVLSVY